MADCPRKKAADSRKKENRERLRSERSQDEGKVRNDRVEADKQRTDRVEAGRERTRSEMSDKSGKILHFILLRLGL